MELDAYRYSIGEVATILKVPVTRILQLIKSGHVSPTEMDSNGKPIFRTVDMWRVCEKLQDEDMAQIKARGGLKGRKDAPTHPEPRS